MFSRAPSKCLIQLTFWQQTKDAGCLCHIQQPRPAGIWRSTKQLFFENLLAFGRIIHWRKPSCDGLHFTSHFLRLTRLLSALWQVCGLKCLRSSSGSAVTGLSYLQQHVRRQHRIKTGGGAQPHRSGSNGSKITIPGFCCSEILATAQPSGFDPVGSKYLKEL